MRTLDEIIDAIKANQSVTHEEAIYSVLVLATVVNSLSMDIVHILCKWSDERKELYKTQKTMYSLALNKSPKEFLGWSNDPQNPEYQRFHKIARKLVNRAINGELPNQKGVTE